MRAKKKIDEKPNPDLSILVAIPAFNEPGLVNTFASVWACERPQGSVEVIALINGPENARKEIQKNNERTRDDALQWIRTHPDDRLKFHVLFCPDLPPKDHGVGLARKLVMDEAARRLLEIKNENGIIASLDADCQCDKNYLTSVEDHFRRNPRTSACSIYFEHPLTNKDKRITEGIIRYELWLRNYIQGLRYAGHPHAYHTLGSAMALRARAYLSQGGMNKRKAAEDFHFLHKMIALGHYTEINETRVIPSARTSGRVPFGTGKAMAQWIQGSRSRRDVKNNLRIYPPEIFQDLKSFLCEVPLFQTEEARRVFSPERLPASVYAFLKKEDFANRLREIRSNTASASSFVVRFFRWFGGLQTLRYVHFARDHFHKERFSLEEACLKLLAWQGVVFDPRERKPDARELLHILRERERDVPRGRLALSAGISTLADPCDEETFHNLAGQDANSPRH